MEKLNSLVGVSLLDKNNRETTLSLLKNKKIIGLFFSKYQCPECVKFLPRLNKLYKEINEKYNDFEIIFIPQNPTQEDFDMYYKKMDFKSIPFSQKEYRMNIKKKYNIKQLPSIVFINNDCETITMNGKILINNLNFNAEQIYQLLYNCNQENN